MNSVFVDTAYWLALLLEGDDYHEKALAWSDGVKSPLITSTAVLLEVGDGLARPAVRDLAGSFIDLLGSLTAIEVHEVNRDLIDEAMELFIARPDKYWSLTDCTSFCIMRERGLTSALTSDRHFIQAGYRALLLEDVSDQPT